MYTIILIYIFINLARSLHIIFLLIMLVCISIYYLLFDCDQIKGDSKIVFVDTFFHLFPWLLVAHFFGHLLQWHLSTEAIPLSLLYTLLWFVFLIFFVPSPDSTYIYYM